MMLHLWPAEEGGYTVTSPLDPALITQAETLEEAFVMAYDAQKCLRAARAKLARRSRGGGAPSGEGLAVRPSPPSRKGQSRRVDID